MTGSGSNSFPSEGWAPGENKAPNRGENSGEDNRGFGGSGGSGGNPVRNLCEFLFETTILNSPNPDVLKELSQDDVLEVGLVDQGRVLAVIYKSSVAGSITSPKLINFIECIQAGFEYVAIVASINGGQCQVTIRPRVKK